MASWGARIKVKGPRAKVKGAKIKVEGCGIIGSNSFVIEHPKTIELIRAIRSTIRGIRDKKVH